ncbi:MAG: hypothetical protein ABSD47_01105 [Candidatus Methylomirabilota bacterium]|jgi:hypothetical protein
MTLTFELADAVSQIVSLLAADANPDTDLTGWSDESWRVKRILTDPIIVPKDYPVIYVLGDVSARELFFADSEYEMRMDIALLVENQYREPTDTTDSRLEIIRLCRRVEEVLRVNRISEPYWYKSIFHLSNEPLRVEVAHYNVGQVPIAAGLMNWCGFRRTQFTT